MARQQHHQRVENVPDEAKAGTVLAEAGGEIGLLILESHDASSFPVIDSNTINTAV